VSNSQPTITTNSDPSENSPLLGDLLPQDVTIQESLVAGNSQRGYDSIRGNIPEEQNEPPEQSLRAIFAVLSVLLVGE
jgi:hypothetical protein